VEHLEGRVAVVTGAGSGIGRALALRFAGEGMRVVAADVEAETLEQTADLLGAAAAEFTTRLCDVADPRQVEELAEASYDTFGAVHLLCNNAGVFAGGLLWERPLEDFTWVLGVNLWGVLHGIRSFVPRMLAGSDEGHVVNTVSAAGLFDAPYAGAYQISKFAAFAATETLAHDLAAVGAPIGVTALCPGAVDTGIATSARNRPADLPGRATPDAEFVEQMLTETTGRGAHPDEVAGVVVQAVRAGRFLAFTHPGYPARLVEQAQARMAGLLPPVVAYE
jgi:NAD(P)-dependent dehydrogenase (short-subunit alcohol dehydrogenase family)